MLVQYWDEEEQKPKVVTASNPLPIAGTAGGGSVNFLSGEGVPGADIGSKNDVYLNTSNGNLYQKNDEWELLMNLTGPQGQRGPEGPQGPAGADGFPSEADWNNLVARVEALEGEG